MLSKLISRNVAQKFVRQYYGPANSVRYIPDVKAADKGDKIFTYISLFICIPVTVGFGIYCYMNLDHPPRPEFVAYDHLYIMNKPFPWGDGKHSLFFNPKINATIDGYETEEEHH